MKLYNDKAFFDPHSAIKIIENIFAHLFWFKKYGSFKW